jgi:mannose-6-phosphate isomerase-like protein (cupin superfamily)
MLVREVEFNPHQTPKVPFNASCFVVQPNCCSPMDSHAVHEMRMVAQGEGELSYEEDISQIHASDFLYFNPPGRHQVKNTGTAPLIVFSVWWK